MDKLLDPSYRTTQLQGITDLTVLAEIKPGFVENAAELRSKRERLQRVLDTLNVVRVVSREAEPQASPFPDAVGRFRGIHFFRFAILPARLAGTAQTAVAPADDGPDRLLLNVTFDGGWEPYMRIIWGPLGTLLDLIFCHCVDYPTACDHAYDEYVHWVRLHEVPSQFFYADSAATVGDKRYLADLELLQRSGGSEPDADRRAAGAATPLRAAAAEPSVYAVNASLRLLGLLLQLRPLFPGQGHAGDHGYLLRFAQDLLQPLRDWCLQGLFSPGARFGDIGSTPEARQALAWLAQPRFDAPRTAPRLRYDASAVQALIASPLPPTVSRGALALLRVTDPVKALAWLAAFAVAVEGSPPADRIYRQLAITYPGLQALGVPAWRLRRLPREFADGMQNRAGILGDLRSNHPRAWVPPRDAAGRAIDLRTVHLVVQLRTELLPEDPARPAAQLLPRLAAALAGADGSNGLELLATQPMHRVTNASGQAVGHFGFVDGVSQPVIGARAAETQFWSDDVPPGELFLGHPNQRDRLFPAPPDTDPADASVRCDRLLDNGSFLVVRKLRQYVDRLERAVGAAGDPALAATLKDRMMGRRANGAPLVAHVGAGGPNDFDYRNDAAGDLCPHASHVRRSNPRDGEPALPIPRLSRRGMSYGPTVDDGSPDDERGLMFIAYNASIAEQFEVVQRWVAGGNASGVSSAQSDPFLGVPEPGRPRVFRCVVDQTVRRIDLGPEPLVSLQWGLYAFVPSARALRELGAIIALPAPAPPAHLPEQPHPVDPWRRRLDDESVRPATWRTVREQFDGVCPAGAYGVLAGSMQQALEVLRDDARFSVRGYGERFEASIGPGFLGQDDDGAFSGHARPEVAKVNQVLWNFVDEAGAFAAARQIAGAVIGTARTQAQTAGLPAATVDLAKLSVAVVASLLNQWFGGTTPLMAPGIGNDDPASTQPPQCPGHFLKVSRYIFSTPHPTDLQRQLAVAQGGQLREAVRQWLAATPPQQRGALTGQLLEAYEGGEEPEAMLTGVMLGFPPTVFGNLLGVLFRWSAGDTLWLLQRDLQNAAAAGGAGYAAARDVLRAPLLQEMARSPVPYVVWRRARQATTLGSVPVAEGQPVIVGLGSAMADPAADQMLMFGGDFAAANHPPHACSGQRMALGCMLGTIDALLSAGSLRPGPTPTQLLLS